jgi:predicted TIM-barrel fold metal-dependent hydrolase
MKSGFRIFDGHAHLGDARHSGRQMSAHDLLRHMDANGVDRAMAIPFPVVDDHRQQHDLIGRAVLEYPDRLRGAACLDPYIPEAEFRDEVRRCREHYGFTALKLQPQYHGLNPFSAASDFLFEAALENKMAVICHTGSGMPFASPALCMVPARKFPELRIVLGHCGGGIYVHEAIVAALFCPNILLELSSLMPHHVREVLNHVSSDRLMIGSDLPESAATEFGKILGMDIANEDKQNILSATADRVFA